MRSASKVVGELGATAAESVGVLETVGLPDVDPAEDCGAVTCVAAVLVGVPAVAAGRCEGVCTAGALVVGVGVGAGFACVADGLGISTAGAHSVDG